VACLAAILAAPALADARAATGGASAPSTTGDPALVGAAAPTGAVATPARTGPDTLAPPPAMFGSVTLIPGRLTAAAAGRPVTLSLLDPVRGFVVVATGRADAAGGFALRWRARHLGRFLLRASLAGHPATSDPVAAIEVYRSVVATWFGPGSYGSRTACGQILTSTLLGVAHRSLPCGTMVDIVYGDQTISVPVVDRGPYASGVSLDLTTATATALGIADTVRLGALAVHSGS
jgi:hypothetical protein